MAKKQNSADPLDAITDFVFSSGQAKKNRPFQRKVAAEANLSDNLAAGITEVVTNPLFYIPKGYDSLFTDTIGNVELTGWNLNSANDDGRFGNADGGADLKIRPNDLAPILKDPSKWIDGVLEKNKAAAKGYKLARFNSGIDVITTLLAAKKSGFAASSAEALNLALAAGTDFGDYEERYLVEDTKNISRISAYQSSYKQAVEEVEAANPGLSRATSTADKNRFFNLVMTRSASLKAEAEDNAKLLSDVFASDSELAGRFFGTRAGVGAISGLTPAQKSRLLSEMATRAGITSTDPRYQSMQRSLDIFENQLTNQGKLESITKYRENLAKANWWQARLESDPREQAKALERGGFSMTLARIKGESGDPDTKDKITAGYTGNNIDLTVAQIDTQLQRLQTAGITSGSAWNALMREKSELIKIHQKMHGTVVGTRLNAQTPWRIKASGNTAIPSTPWDIRKAGLAQVRAESAIIESKIALLENEGTAEANADIYFLRESLGINNAFLNGTKPVPFFDRAIYFSSLVQSIDAVRKNKNLLSADGFAFWGTPFSPGQLAAKARMGDISYGYDASTGQAKMYSKAAMIVRNDSTHFLGRHYNKLADLYYLTPSSLLKTAFYDGQLYRYWGFRENDRLGSMVVKNQTELTTWLQANGATFLTGGEIDLTKLYENGDVFKIIDLLEANEASLSPQMKALYKRMKNSQSRLNFWGNIASKYDKFSPILLAQNLLDKASKKLRKEKLNPRLLSLFQKLLDRGILKPGGMIDTAFKGFMAGTVGLRQLFQTVVRAALKKGFTAVLSLVGLASGGVVTVLVWLFEPIITGGLMKLIKPTFLTIFFFILGLCAIPAIIISLVSVFFSPQSTVPAYTQSPITEVQYCNIGLSPVGGVNNGQVGVGVVPPDAICPVNVGSICTQGPNGKWSHAKQNKAAIDVYSSIFKAPSDGTVVRSSTSQDCEWDSGNDRGGEVIYKDDSGNTYYIYHVVPMVGTGPVSQGTILARMATGLPDSLCWTGPHLHLHTNSGGWVNSEQWYEDLKCNLTDCPE